MRRISLSAGVEEARAQSRPDLFVEARHETLNPFDGGNTLRVGVTLPIKDMGRNRAEVRVAQAAVTEQDAVLTEAARIASLEIASAWRELERARREVESFRAGRLDQAKELLTMAQFGYERGATSYLELLDAQRVARVEQAEYAKALTTYRLALASLTRAVGGRLP